LRLLTYDSETGELRWIAPGRGCRVGDLAGYHDSAGYRLVEIDHQIYLAHRIIWKMMTANDPAILIDHKDGDKDNNRWGNLREATKAENQRNSKKPVSNTSGVKGVCWDVQAQRWLARISVNSRNIHIGTFTNLADAARARQLAAEQMHGAFARGG
jgi:hypothetical protein